MSQLSTMANVSKFANKSLKRMSLFKGVDLSMGFVDIVHATAAAFFSADMNVSASGSQMMSRYLVIQRPNGSCPVQTA